MKELKDIAEKLLELTESGKLDWNFENESVISVEYRQAKFAIMKDVHTIGLQVFKKNHSTNMMNQFKYMVNKDLDEASYDLLNKVFSHEKVGSSYDVVFKLL